MSTVTLYRPVGPKELELVAASGWTRFPPRLPEQPIARDWNVKASGSGFVLRFEVDAEFLSKYPVQQVGAAVHREFWSPAEDLDAFNDRIAGASELVESYP